MTRSPIPSSAFGIPDIRAHLDAERDCKTRWPDPRISLNPNFRGGGTVQQLVDEQVLHPGSKYKRQESTDNLYQMLAYCVRLGLADGHLVYVDGGDDSVEVPVAATGTAGAERVVRLHRHRLDLTLPPRVLEAAVATLAERILPGDRRAAP